MDLCVIVVTSVSERENAEDLFAEIVVSNSRAKGFNAALFHYKYGCPNEEDMLVQFCENILQHSPKLVYCSLEHDNINIFTLIVKQLKAKKLCIPIAVGSSYAASDWEYCLEVGSFDFLIPVHEYVVVPELLRAITEERNPLACDGIVYFKDDQLVENRPVPVPDFDTLPFASREMVNHSSSYIKMYTNKGCMWNCAFCWTSSTKKAASGKNPVAKRSIASVVDEIQELKEKIPTVNTYAFIDDCFCFPPGYQFERIKQFCNALETQGLKIYYRIHSRADVIAKLPDTLIQSMIQNGLIDVFIGFESGYDSTLKIFNKKTTVQQNLMAAKILNKYAIPTRIGFIMFHPYSTVEEFSANCAFLHRIGQSHLFYLYLKYLIAFKNSPLYLKIKNDGLLTRSYSLENPYGYEIADSRMREIAGNITSLVKAHTAETSYMFLLLDLCTQLESTIAKIMKAAPFEIRRHDLLDWLNALKKTLGNRNNVLFQSFAAEAFNEHDMHLLIKKSWNISETKKLISEITKVNKHANELLRQKEASDKNLI